MTSSDVMGYLAPKVYESFCKEPTPDFSLLLEKKVFLIKLKKDLKSPETRKNGLYQQNLRIEALINAFVIEGKDKYLEFASELHDKFIRNKYTVRVPYNQEVRVARAKKIQKSSFNSSWQLQLQAADAFMQLEAFKYDLALHNTSADYFPITEGRRAFDRALENYVFVEEINSVLRHWKEYASFDFGFLNGEASELVRKGNEESDFLILLETQTLKERVKESLSGDKKMVTLHQLDKRIQALFRVALLLRNNSFLLAGLELRDFAFGFVKDVGSSEPNSETEDIKKGLADALACLRDLSFIYSNEKIEVCNLDLSLMLQTSLKELSDDTGFTANFQEKNKERLSFLEGPRTFLNVLDHLQKAKKLKSELNNHKKMRTEKSRKASLLDEMKISIEKKLSPRKESPEKESPRNECQKDEPSPREDSRENEASASEEKEMKQPLPFLIDPIEVEEASPNSKYREKAHEQQVKAFQKVHLKQKELISFFIKKLTEDPYLKENFSSATGLFFQAPSTVEEIIQELQSECPLDALKILLVLKRKIPEIFFHE